MFCIVIFCEGRAIAKQFITNLENFFKTNASKKKKKGCFFKEEDYEEDDPPQKEEIVFFPNLATYHTVCGGFVFGTKCGIV